MFPIPCKLLTLSLLGLLATLGTAAIARVSIAPLMAQSQPNNTTIPVAQKLLGQWQGQPSANQTLIFIFSPDSKLFTLLPNAAETLAQQLGYRIDAKTQPMQLDVTIPGRKEKVLTIFEFTPKGQLRMQVTDTGPGKPRPTAFNANATLFQKISDATTLPANTRMVNTDTGANRPPEEGRQSIGLMNRAQQAYYLENAKFATTIEQLGVGMKPETESYRYQILPQGNQTQSVMMTAQAKRPEFKSYTGVVFVRKNNGEAITQAGICETEKPSSTPPAMPKLPNDTSGQIQCPAGSSNPTAR